MGIKITASGMHTTVQDLGRAGFQRYGFSQSGAMDQLSLKLANLLVGNESDEAGLEMMVTGCSVSFTYPNTIAVTGANCQPRLNGEPVRMYQALHVKAGDELTTGRIKGGTFSYIAFAGGLAVPEVMNSRSTSTRFGIGGFNGRILQTEDALLFRHPETSPSIGPPREVLDMTVKDSDEKVIIRVIPTCQTDLFTEKDTAILFETDYTVSLKSDRMGYRLEGKKIETKAEGSILSEATVLGDIQVPPDGQPIVLLADRQTTGGYPVIGTVCTVDLPKLVQCYPGKRIQFSPITLKEAQASLRQQERFLEKLEKDLLDKKPISIYETDEDILLKKAENEDWHHRNIKELIDTVNTSSLTVFEFEDETIRIKLDKRQGELKEGRVSHSSKTGRTLEPVPVHKETAIISSTLVGLFYTCPELKGSPFVIEGDRVEAGQTVGRIEAMNITYDVKADKDGTLRSVLVEDGQMVEYGQPLMELESEDDN